MSRLISVDLPYEYTVHGICDPLRWSYIDSKWWAISTQLTLCNIPAEQRSLLKRIRSLGNYLLYLLLGVGASVSIEVTIIHATHCTCGHLHTPTYVHNKIISYTKTWTLLHGFSDKSSSSGRRQCNGIHSFHCPSYAGHICTCHTDLIFLDQKPWHYMFVYK
jgi:hypothetical protein